MPDANRFLVDLAGYAEAARAALCARTLDELTSSLWSALDSMGVRGSRRHLTSSQAGQLLRLAIQRMAACAEQDQGALALRVWKSLARPAAPEAQRRIWLSLVAQGTAGLRTQYLQDLAALIPARIGTEVMCVADLGGDPLYVQTPEQWRESIFGSVRARNSARRIAMALAADCRAPGVFALGRLRIGLHERQLRMLLEARLSFDLSNTGLPAIIVRGVRADVHDELPPMAEPVPQTITLPQRLALAV